VRGQRPVLEQEQPVGKALGRATRSVCNRLSPRPLPYTPDAAASLNAHVRGLELTLYELVELAGHCGQGSAGWQLTPMATPVPQTAGDSPPARARMYGYLAPNRRPIRRTHDFADTVTCLGACSCLSSLAHSPAGSMRASSLREQLCDEEAPAACEGAEELKEGATCAEVEETACAATLAPAPTAEPLCAFPFSESSPCVYVSLSPAAAERAAIKAGKLSVVVSKTDSPSEKTDPTRLEGLNDEVREHAAAARSCGAACGASGGAPAGSVVRTLSSALG